MALISVFYAQLLGVVEREMERAAHAQTPLRKSERRDGCACDTELHSDRLTVCTNRPKHD